MTAAVRVVVVHGLWYGRPGMLPLARRLKNLGWDCELFGYSSVFARPADNVARLAECAQRTGGDRLHFVGHSLGGLLILKMLVEAGEALPAGRVVLLGSPLKGSAVARHMAGNRALRPWVGRAEALLDHGMDRLPEGRQIAAIAGTSSFGAGRLIARLEKPHDGTVAVAETKVPGLVDHLELPVSHTGLVLSQKAAAAVDAFLRKGHFRSSTE